MKKYTYVILSVLLATFLVGGVYAKKMNDKKSDQVQKPNIEKSMAFVRDGKLYRGSTKNDVLPVLVDKNGEKEFHIAHTLHNKDMQLIKAWSKNDYNKGELILMKDDGSMKVITTIIDPLDVGVALSPDGKYVVMVNPAPEHKGFIIDLDGNVTEDLPSRVFGAVWNNAGTGIAYTKVSTTSCDKNGSNDIMDSDYCMEGLVFYDLESKEETQLTDSGEDYAPKFFSPDDTKLYFSSTRPYEEDSIIHVNSAWEIDLVTKEVERLTNKEYSPDVYYGVYQPGFGDNSLWFAENAVFTDFDGKIWKFDFSPTQKAPQLIFEGDNIRWKEKGKSIVAHTYHNGFDKWEDVPLE